MKMDQARLVYCNFGIDCQCFYFFYNEASIFCFDWMTKGMSQLETTGPALADYLGWKSDLGRVSFRVIGLCLSPNNCSACLYPVTPRRLSCHLLLSVVTRLPSLQVEIKLHLLSR
ncbi:hypothetical protein V6N12_034529 [Hibiscus sabdariffa]|uniref:Uncharacterized protein n=1 Tax=Hibiscus sabdariffa TaxID=183260 RepID=A0ABR2DHF1_9ROSI